MQNKKILYILKKQVFNVVKKKHIIGHNIPQFILDLQSPKGLPLLTHEAWNCISTS